MKKRHILFVCTEGRQRSPTAAEIISSSPAYSKKYEAKAVGLSELAVVHISKAAVQWADLIIVMNEKDDHHKSILLQKFPFIEKEKKSIIDFNIRDIYWKNEPELQELIQKKLRKYLHEKVNKKSNTAAKKY